jgi:hypothetical protein
LSNLSENVYHSGKYLTRRRKRKRRRKELRIKDPWLEGELGPVTMQESSAAMMKSELKERGKAGWEEVKKY